MNRSRTASIVIGITFFIFGIGIAFLYNKQTMTDSLNVLLEEKINHLEIGELALREHQEINNRITDIEKALHNLHNKNSLTEEQIIKLMETNIELKKSNVSAEETDIPKDSISTKTEHTYSHGSPAEFEEAHYQKLEDVFFEGEVDPQFTASLTSKLEESIEEIRQQTSSTASILDTDCKAEMCRIEISFTDDQAGEAAGFLELTLLQRVGNEISTSASRNMTDETGKVKSTVYYLSRSANDEQRSQNVQPTPTTH